METQHMNEKAPDEDLIREAEEQLNADTTATGTQTDEAIEVRGYVRTRGRQEGKTAALNIEQRLRASLAIITRCSSMVEDARNLEVLAQEVGDNSLRKSARQHVVACEALLAHAVKRAGSVVE